MLRILWQIAIILMLTISVWAQDDSKIVAQNLATYYNGDYSGVKQFVLPVSINRFLPEVLLIERKKEIAFKTETNTFALLFKKAKILNALKYVDLRAKKNGDGTVTVKSVSDRTRFPSVEFKDKIYIFAGEHFDTKADAEIFNLFLKEANLKIENEKEAAELANLYFSVTRGYFENKGKLILSDVEDVPLSYRKAKEAEAKRLQEIVVAPKAKLVGESYEVELFTWEMALGEVKNWSFKIQPDAQIEVQSEIIGKL